ncbi:alpha-ribazole phosphatase family protein [Dyadobacter aurulentus]|uniref:alpha-ribazole phosphatase family protein n=1 Tax=Dyadobacter sp. UC 10 TaxID=2605428 RepID=UPI0011F3D531|nr:alpha-ribazole phosphatase family protein [Dyadobacter sp. UC 10]KAA0993322.1 alpha-ribazole phosphatase family protein [Dyadobacter sp. UC 10]
MEIYLIRHTTPLVPVGQIYGWSEVPLHTNSAEEIEAVRLNLPAQFDKVYSSPSLRCTALATKINADFVIDPRLRELHFGDWEGKTWDAVDQRTLQFWMDDYVNVCVPGGESMLQMQFRIISFWNELKKESPEKVAVISHAGVIRILLAIHNSTELKDCFDYKVNFGEIIVLHEGSQSRLV